jgi:hypothetical protein
VLCAATQGLPAADKMSQGPATVPPVQTPAVQVWPVVQALPQVPQLAASVRRFLQVPEQLV